jgi:hypothetical protein
VGSFKFKITSFRVLEFWVLGDFWVLRFRFRVLGFRVMKDLNLSKPTIFFLHDFHSYGEDYHPFEVSLLLVQLNRTSSTKLQKGKKRDDWPSSHGRRGNEWGMFAACPQGVWLHLFP